MCVCSRSRVFRACTGVSRHDIPIMMLLLPHAILTVVTNGDDSAAKELVLAEFSAVLEVRACVCWGGGGGGGVEQIEDARCCFCRAAAFASFLPRPPPSHHPARSRRSRITVFLNRAFDSGALRPWDRGSRPIRSIGSFFSRRSSPCWTSSAPGHRVSRLKGVRLNKRGTRTVAPGGALPATLVTLGRPVFFATSAHLAVSPALLR